MGGRAHRRKRRYAALLSCQMGQAEHRERSKPLDEVSEWIPKAKVYKVTIAPGVVAWYADTGGTAVV